MDNIVVIGSANVDMTVTVESFPKAGETIFSTSMERFPGGKGANQAVGCAKLGASTTFIGKMGKDGFKDYLFDNMGKNGVVLDNVILSDSSPTGTAFITVDKSGQNQIVVVSGANMELTAGEIETCRAGLDEADVVLTQLEIPVEAVQETIELARRKSITSILNPAPARLLPEELLRNVDFLTPNETELEILSGMPVGTTDEIIAAARSLIKKGVKNIIVTIGKDGALWVSETEERIFPARVVTAIDTTAAGDAFNGALAVALSRGLPISEAIEFSNLVASISVTRMGAQTSMPTMGEVEDLILSLKVV